MNVFKIIKKIICIAIIGSLLLQELSWANPIFFNNRNSEAKTKTLQVQSLFQTQQLNLLALPILIEQLIETNKDTPKEALTTVEIANILNLCQGWKEQFKVQCVWDISDDFKQIAIKIRTEVKVLHIRYFFSHEATEQILPDKWKNVKVERINRYLCKQVKIEQLKDVVDDNKYIISAKHSQQSKNAYEQLLKRYYREKRSDEKKGSAAEPYKMGAGAIIGVAAFILFLPLRYLTLNGSVNAFFYLYLTITAVLPLLTAAMMEKALFLPENTREHSLITPFKTVEDIQNIVEYDNDAKGKISYYSYITKKLYIDTIVMKRVPKLFQYIIYLHEMIHEKLKVKTEVVAVSFTFCIPAAFVSLIMGSTFFIVKISASEMFFFWAISVYNFLFPFVAKLVSRKIGVVKSEAGHYLLSRKNKRYMQRQEIDQSIVDYVKQKTFDPQTGQQQYWREWLKGQDSHSMVHLIKCEGHKEDIIVIRAGNIAQKKLEMQIKENLKTSSKAKFVLIIAANGKNKRRIYSVFSTAKNAIKNMTNKKIISIDVCSTKYNLRRLKELESFYKKRLERIKHGSVVKEAVASEIHGQTGRLEKMLKWLRKNKYRELVLMGDYIAKKGNGYEAIDILKRHKLSLHHPSLKMLMGRSEHLFLRVMFGDKQFSPIWPEIATMEGPAIIDSLMQLQDITIIQSMPDTEKHDILEARKFKQILIRELQNEGKPLTEENIKVKLKKHYRFHPKLIDIADFIVEYMNFVFYENSNHTIYMIGSIPENFQWKGLRGIGALIGIEKEFKKQSLRRLRLLKISREIWVSMNSVSRKTNKFEWLNSVEENLWKIVKGEREKADITGNELISEDVLDSFQEKVRDIIRTVVGGNKVITADKAEEIRVKLIEVIEDINKQLPEIFEIVFHPEGSPFITETKGGIETKEKTYQARLEKRLKIREILGVNTVVTPAAFLTEGYQSLKQLMVVDNNGTVKMLDVDSLEGFNAKEMTLILSAKEAHEIEAGQSLEEVTRKKLKENQEILASYSYLGINVSKVKQTKIVKSILTCIAFIEMIERMIEGWFKDINAEKEIQAYIEKGKKLLDGDDVLGAVFLQQALISDDSTKEQESFAIDTLLKALSPERSEAIRGNVVEVLTGMLVVCLEDEKQAQRVFSSLMDHVYPWVEEMGVTEPELKYKEQIMMPFVLAVKKNIRFRKFVISYGKKRRNKQKKWFVNSLLEKAETEKGVLVFDLSSNSNLSKLQKEALFKSDQKVLLEELMQMLILIANNNKATSSFKKKTKNVIAIDTGFSVNEDVNDMIMENVIRPLRNLSKNNEVLSNILEEVEIIGGDVDYLEQSLNKKISEGVTTIDEVTLITSEKNRIKFSQKIQLRANITSLEINEKENMSSYIPVLEVVLFALLRATTSKKEYLMAAYQRIEGASNLKIKKLIDLCFKSGVPKKTVILTIVPQAKKQKLESIEQKYRNIKILIYSV